MYIYKFRNNLNFKLEIESRKSSQHCQESLLIQNKT